MKMSTILTLCGSILTIGGVVIQTISGMKLKDEFNNEELEEIETTDFEEINEEA